MMRTGRGDKVKGVTGSAFGGELPSALLGTLLAALFAGCAAPALRTGSASVPSVKTDTVYLPAPAISAGKLTLEEAVQRMSDALLRAPAGTAWKPEAARAREIREARPQVSELVEDAEWVLVLSAELDGPRPTADKNRLRRLHERYAALAPHEEIVSLINDLLADVREEDLRLALKKLANRSWEREKRLGASDASEPRGATSTAPVATPVVSAPAMPVAPVVDSAALSVSPDRYCAERRAEAARAFAAAKESAGVASRERHLRRSLELLDDCLRRYPDSPEAEKARQNRARVEQELGK